MRGSRALTAAALALAAALPYLAAGPGASFVELDDPLYVSENPVVLRGLTPGGIRWAFTTFHAGNWHPLTWLSHMADVSLFGADPRWHHGAGILIHAATAALLFLAFARLTGSAPRAALAAALFAAHPLRVESVAWAAERKDLLAGLFFALVLLAWERYVRRGGRGRYAAVAALLALGLLAKPMLVTVPLVLLILDRWPLGRLPGAGARPPGAAPATRDLLLEKLPLLALCAASVGLTLAAQLGSHALPGIRILDAATRLSNALVSTAAYLGKTLWPAALAVYYPHPLRPHPAGVTAAAALLLLAVAAGALLLRRSRPHLLAGCSWFAVMLLPVLGLVQVGGQAMADRYTYLPHVGLAVAAAWSLPAPGRRRAALAAWAVSGVAVALLAAASARQAGYWRDSETLFTRALAVTRRNGMIEASLGNVRYSQGRYAEAAAGYRRAIAIFPGRWELHVDLGNVLAAQGLAREAREEYRKALALDPAAAGRAVPPDAQQAWRTR